MARTNGAELVARAPSASMEGGRREELHRILQTSLGPTWPNSQAVTVDTRQLLKCCYGKISSQGGAQLKVYWCLYNPHEY